LRIAGNTSEVEEMIKAYEQLGYWKNAEKTEWTKKPRGTRPPVKRVENAKTRNLPRATPVEKPVVPLKGKSPLLRQLDDIIEDQFERADIHSIAGVLKRYYFTQILLIPNDLNEQLYNEKPCIFPSFPLTEEYVECVSDCLMACRGRMQMKRIKGMLDKLPVEKYYCLMAYYWLLVKIERNSAVNYMTAKYLGIISAAALDAKGLKLSVLNYTEHLQNLATDLVLNFNDYFGSTAASEVEALVL
jgi:hypothetical protein